MAERRPGEGLETPRAPLDMRPYPHYVCPRCRRIIGPDADRCASCGQALAPAWSLVDLLEALEELPAPGPPSEPTEAPQYPRLVAVHEPTLSGDWEWACPVCEAEVHLDVRRCGACGQVLHRAEDEELEEDRS